MTLFVVVDMCGRSHAERERFNDFLCTVKRALISIHSHQNPVTVSLLSSIASISTVLLQKVRGEDVSVYERPTQGYRKHREDGVVTDIEEVSGFFIAGPTDCVPWSSKTVLLRALLHRCLLCNIPLLGDEVTFRCLWHLVYVGGRRIQICETLLADGGIYMHKKRQQRAVSDEAPTPRPVTRESACKSVVTDSALLLDASSGNAFSFRSDNIMMKQSLFSNHMNKPEIMKFGSTASLSKDISSAYSRGSSFYNIISSNKKFDEDHQEEAIQEGEIFDGEASERSSRFPTTSTSSYKVVNRVNCTDEPRSETIFDMNGNATPRSFLIRESNVGMKLARPGDSLGNSMSFSSQTTNPRMMIQRCRESIQHYAFHGNKKRAFTVPSPLNSKSAWSLCPIEKVPGGWAVHDDIQILAASERGPEVLACRSVLCTNFEIVPEPNLISIVVNFANQAIQSKRDLIEEEMTKGDQLAITAVSPQEKALLVEWRHAVTAASSRPEQEQHHAFSHNNQYNLYNGGAHAQNHHHHHSGTNSNRYSSDEGDDDEDNAFSEANRMYRQQEQQKKGSTMEQTSEDFLFPTVRAFTNPEDIPIREKPRAFDVPSVQNKPPSSGVSPAIGAGAASVFAGSSGRRRIDRNQGTREIVLDVSFNVSPKTVDGQIASSSINGGSNNKGNNIGSNSGENRKFQLDLSRLAQKDVPSVESARLSRPGAIQTMRLDTRVHVLSGAKRTIDPQTARSSVDWLSQKFIFGEAYETFTNLEKKGEEAAAGGVGFRLSPPQNSTASPPRKPSWLADLVGEEMDPDGTAMRRWIKERRRIREESLEREIKTARDRFIHEGPVVIIHGKTRRPSKVIAAS